LEPVLEGSSKTVSIWLNPREDAIMLLTHHQTKRSRLLIIAIVATLLIGTTALTRAKNSTGINITIRNNSQRAILHVYLAAGDPNNWGPDQLNGSIISAGGSYVVSDVACSGSTIRVIAEDQGGCFVYSNASCDGNQTWEITDNTTPDCGD
jgi:hypothetical protein